MRRKFTGAKERSQLEAETSGRAPVEMSRLSWAMQGKRGREEEREEPGATARRLKSVTKTAGLYREEQPSPLGWRGQGKGGVCKPRASWNRQELRDAVRTWAPGLICYIIPQPFVPRFET